MQNKAVFAGFAIVVAGVIAAPAAFADSGQKSKAKLSGMNEVPKADPDGRGEATVTVWGSDVCWRIKVQKIAPAAAAHIHAAVAGVNGPVVVPLTTPNADGWSAGCATVAAPLAANIAAHPEQYYVNVHNAAYPGGAVRGQLGNH